VRNRPVVSDEREIPRETDRAADQKLHSTAAKDCQKRNGRADSKIEIRFG